MCGTSQDGLDIADVEFTHNDGRWEFDLIEGFTLDLPSDLRQQLRNAPDASALELTKTDRMFAAFSGKAVKDHLERSGSTATFIGSHGVTVFHQPASGFTHQLGSGAVIASISGLDTVCDFRQQDVSKGGQGAPLVPSCDHLLFPDQDATLNLGGFANVSLLDDQPRGFDVGACNLILNAIVQETGRTYDDKGTLASRGRLIPGLFDALEALGYFQQAPGSLGAEWFQSEVSPILEQFKTKQVEDRLHTACEHIAVRVAHHLNDRKSVLVTGGGAHNSHLIERLSTHSEAQIVVPDTALIDMKEAICFAFLGLLRLHNAVNIYRSSTGARSDSVAGAVYKA